MTDLTTIPAVWPGRSHAGLMLCLGDMRSIAPILLLSSAIGGASRRNLLLAGRSLAASGIFGGTAVFAGLGSLRPSE